MIRRRGIAKHLQLTYSHVRTLRNHLRTGKTISLDKQLRLLQKAGWRMDDKIFNQKDLVSLTRFILSSSAAAQGMGPEYLVEKFLKRPK